MEYTRVLHLIENTLIMQPIQSISIPQPCHQNWNQMTQVEQGRHCAQCSKTVTDFTAMSNKEIVNYFAHYGNFCGRFGKTQLNGLNNYLAVEEQPRFSWKKLAIAAAVTSLFATLNVEARNTLGKVRVSQSVNQGKNAALKDSVTYVTIKGNVLSSDDKLPVAGAAVYLKDKSIGTQTNVTGDFTLKVPSGAAQTILISFIGYKSLEIKAMDFLNNSTPVMLQISPAMMGEVMVIQRPGFVKRCWYKLKRLF